MVEVRGLGKFKKAPALLLSSSEPGSQAVLNVTFELRDAMQPLSTLQVHLPGFKHLRDRNTRLTADDWDECQADSDDGVACTKMAKLAAVQNISVQGPDAAMFGYDAAIACNDTSEPPVFVGCDWSPSALPKSVPGVCYHVRCPPGCSSVGNSESAAVYGKCDHL